MGALGSPSISYYDLCLLQGERERENDDGDEDETAGVGAGGRKEDGEAKGVI